MCQHQAILDTSDPYENVWSQLDSNQWPLSHEPTMLTHDNQSELSVGKLFFFVKRATMSVYLLEILEAPERMAVGVH